jgi:hypothetical protein
MSKSFIFIDEAKFTADDHTINAVITAIEGAGFEFDDVTEGFVSPGFYEERAADREAMHRFNDGPFSHAQSNA